MSHLSEDQVLTVVFLILAAVAFGFEAAFMRSLLAAGLLLATLAFLVPLLT